MRWSTRSEPERSTSMSMPGYSARKALATASATLTSTEVYQVTLPSLEAAATMAGVVSCAWAPGATTQIAFTANNKPSMARFILFLPRCMCMRHSSPSEASAALGGKPHTDGRPRGNLQVWRRRDQDLLADIHD